MTRQELIDSIVAKAVVAFTPDFAGSGYTEAQILTQVGGNKMFPIMADAIIDYSATLQAQIDTLTANYTALELRVSVLDGL